MRRLILFDIDGTLLHADGAARRAFGNALHEVFGRDIPADGHSFAGKTDPQIARELLIAAGIDERRITEGLPALWRSYVERLPREISKVAVRVLPGVNALLCALEQEAQRAERGLLTGNLRDGARIKMEAAGLPFERFGVGAFGSDYADRRELPALAVRRAEQSLGYQFRGKDVVVIGDTPADIACGEHLGVRTIAVATGGYSEADLAARGPDHLFANLEDTEAVCAAIFHG